MNKIVINCSYGGFGISKKAFELGAEISANCNWFPTSRHDPVLVQVVEHLGEESHGGYAYLKVVEIEGDKYQIVNYDGWEKVNTPSSIEWEVIK